MASTCFAKIRAITKAWRKHKASDNQWCVWAKFPDVYRVTQDTQPRRGERLVWSAYPIAPQASKRNEQSITN